MSFPPSIVQYANLAAQPSWATSNSGFIYLAELPPSTSIMVGILVRDRQRSVRDDADRMDIVLHAHGLDAQPRVLHLREGSEGGTSGDLNITWTQSRTTALPGTRTPASCLSSTPASLDGRRAARCGS